MLEKSRYATTIAFLILAIATAYGFLRVAQLAEDVETQSIRRAELLCEKDNEVRSLLGTTLRSLFDTSDQNNFSEELAVIEERLTALESTVLAPTDCASVAENRTTAP